MIKVHKFFQSLKFALRGFSYAIRREQNFRIHVLVTACVTVLMLYLPLSKMEYLILVLIIVIVLVLELINTIFEKIVDILKPRIHPYAEIIKDMMAAAVLVASIGAVIIGYIIFTPYILEILRAR